MSSFTRQPQLTFLGNDEWRVDNGFEYHVGNINSGFVIAIPAGFLTDLTSVPKCFQWALPPDGRYSHAAIIHDWLYDNAIASKPIADLIFYEAMGTLGVNIILRRLMWLAVRVFGRGNYNK